MKEKTCGVILYDAYIESLLKLSCIIIYDSDRKNGEIEVIDRPVINDYLFLSTIKKNRLYISNQIVVTGDALWLHGYLIDSVIMKFKDFVELMKQKSYVIDGFNDLEDRILEVASFPLVERISIEYYERLIALDYNITLINDLGYKWIYEYLHRGYIEVVNSARALIKAKAECAPSDEIYMLNKKLAISYIYFFVINRMPRYECKGYDYNTLLSYNNIFDLLK